ncbi:hypothetical protein CGRA01v4_11425 [Colletotrichum graminicola]|nr:hypothetical protein CGRA01v4_11425 [Colletotrichum graminicola]
MVRKQECWLGYLWLLRVAGFHGTDQIGRGRETIGACHLFLAPPRVRKAWANWPHHVRIQANCSR